MSENRVRVEGTGKFCSGLFEDLSSTTEGGSAKCCSRDFRVALKGLSLSITETIKDQQRERQKKKVRGKQTRKHPGEKQAPRACSLPEL